MPVTEQIPVVSHSGNGVTTVFAYNFKILAAADIEVSVDGVVKTLTTDYSVSGVGAGGGGNVTMVSPPASGTGNVVLRRNMAYKRTAYDYQEGGDFMAETIDADIDSAVMMLQQLDSELTRAVKLPVGTVTNQEIAETAAERADKLLGFDSAGNLSVLALADASVETVTPFAESLLDDVDAAAARATLGAAASSNARVDVASATTLDLDAVTSDYLRITGTTTVTGVTLAAGQRRLAIAEGAFQLTDGASLVVQGNANYTTTADDLLLFIGESGGVVRVFAFPAALGAALNGTVPKSDAYTVVAADRGKVIQCTGTWTLSLTDAGTLGDGFVFGVQNSGAGTITIDPNASETIDGGTTKNLAAGAFVLVYCDGAKFVTVGDGITLGTPTASTSGTSIDFIGIPATAKRIIINGIGVSTNNTSPLACQLGDSGGIENTGYVSGVGKIAGAINAQQSTTMFLMSGDANDAAADAMSFKIQLDLENASNNTWTFSSVMVLSGTAEINIGGGHKATSATLDRVRITTVGGTATFDAGEINIAYE